MRRVERGLRVCAAVCAYGMLALHLALGAVGLLPGWEYSLRNKTLWLALSCAVLLVAAVLECVPHPASRRYRFIHLLAWLAIVPLFAGSGDLRGIDFVLMLVLLGLSGFLFAKSKGGRKRLVGILTVLIAIPLACFFIFGFFTRDFGSATCRTLASPGGAYEAEVRIVDQGALGGDTILSVYRKGEGLSLPFGALRRPLFTRRSGWTDPAALAFRWEGDETIILNGDTLRWQSFVESAI
ncbi:MAG: hypothetical protein Q4E18_09950 [Clostridia bacterium]|nr:hypothetical protein [Clostridia bacterium]